VAWSILVLSGLLEAVWAIALDRSQGLRRPIASIVFAAGLVASLMGLAFAMDTLPAGTAYAVWVGVGATATVLYAIATGTESASAGRVLMLILLVGSVVGLKVVS